MASPRLGLLAQPHRTGAGIQQWEFARNMEVSKVLLTDLNRLHRANSRNAKQVSNVDWFNDYERMTVDGMPDTRACEWLLEGIDLLFVIETPLFWPIFDMARKRGVKSILAPNAEFLEYELRPVPKPDLFLAPTKWLIDRVAKYGEVKYLPVPIATDRIQKREITKARKFVHITGHKAFLDRNGTDIVRQSIRFVHNIEIEIKIHDQSKNELPNYWNLYDEGDVLLLPRRYGGLSLQLQEAAAAGMPVVVTNEDIYADEPCTVTVPPPYEHTKVKLRGEIDCYSAQPQELGKIIDYLAGMDSIEFLSKKAHQWAEYRSWRVLKRKYQETFSDLCA